MDPLTALIFCFIAARFIVNRWEDHQLVKQGKEPPRWSKAKANAESSGRTPAQEYRSQLWADALENAKKRHAVRHGERFERWEERRRRRQERRARRKARRRERRDKKRQEQTPTSTTPEPSPQPDPQPTPPTGGAIPNPGAPDMTNPTPVPPSGEINDQPTLVRRTGEWRGFHAGLASSGESAATVPESWQNAANRGVSSTEQSLSYLASGKVTGPVVDAFVRAKEQQTRMAMLAGEIASKIGEFIEANRSADAAFEEAQKQMPSHIAVREAHNAVTGSAGSTEFITSGG